MAEAKTKPAAQKAAPAAKPAAAKKSTAATPKTKAPAAAKPATAKPAAKRAPAKKAAAWNPGNEERYNMVQVAAYYLAERDNFAGSPVEYWTAAEMQITGMLPKK